MFILKKTYRQNKINFMVIISIINIVIEYKHCLIIIKIFSKDKQHQQIYSKIIKIIFAAIRSAITVLISSTLKQIVILILNFCKFISKKINLRYCFNFQSILHIFIGSDLFLISTVQVDFEILRSIYFSLIQFVINILYLITAGEVRFRIV